MALRSRARTRALLPVAVLALAGFALAGCSGTSTPSASSSSDAKACAPASGGSTVDKIKVTGAVKTEPTVSFDAPLKASGVQRHVVTEGKGAPTKVGDAVQVDVAIYNGTTGKAATAAGYGGDSPDPLTITIDGTRLNKGILQTLACAPVGSRIVSVMPSSLAFGSTGNSSIGIGAKDSVVFVFDVVRLQPTKADGKVQPAPAGFPKVTFAKDGTPKVAVTKDITAPEQTMIGLLKQGDGTVVQSGDTVTLQYQGVNLRTGKVFDQSWGKGPTQLSTTGVIPGFAKALVGQKVGSQVIVMIPPADGYGSSGQSAAGIEGTDTLIFVIDILGTSTAAQ
jgi:peptidylprolyl isomerase